MKRFIIALIALVTLEGINAFAQEIYPSRMWMENGKLYFAGKEINSSEALDLLGPEIYYDTYVDAVRQFKNGRALILSGGVTACAGIALSIVGLVDGSDGCYIAGIGLAVAADLLLAGGCPIYCIGKRRLEWAAREYNKLSHSSGVTIAPATNGVGLALVF